MIKNDATQSTPGVRPKFYNDVFNGLPSVRFDGTNYIVLSMRGLENSNFTIFIVEKRGGDNSTYDEFLAGSAAGNPRLGYRNGSTAIFYLVNDLDYSSQYFVNHVPLIHTYWLSGTAGKKYWLNGGKNPVTADSSQTTLAPSLVNYSAGAYGSNKYEGDIAEIIAFSRTLNDVERRSVESYLGQKYKITLSQ
ncbi:MAG: hypothetical protein KGQ36_00640 [Rickettsiales bacterium]|nr:hypothetical protein [Rickettsiales bacterium]